MPRLTLLTAGHVSFLSRREWAIVARRFSLSSRELQIVEYAFDDEKELAMAEMLGISPHTVHTHVERLYRKLGVRSRVELVAKIAFEALTLARQRRLSPTLAARRAAA